MSLYLTNQNLFGSSRHHHLELRRDAHSGGNVGTNGNVSLSGNKTVIYGTAATDYSTITGNCSKSTLTGLSTSGGAQVTGGQVPPRGPINYPAPPTPYPAPPTTAENVSPSCPSGMR